MTKRPMIGEGVHYMNLGDKDGRYPPTIQAAVITGVYIRSGDSGDLFSNAGPFGGDGVMEVDLHIQYRTGQFDMQKVPFSPHPERGHWTWPPNN